MTTFLLYLILLLLNGSNGQINITKTIPSGDDPIVAAAVGTKNLVIFCEIIDSVSGELERITRWELTIQGMSTILLFDSDGIPGANTDSQNFMTSPNSDFRRNLTILEFISNYEGAQIGCGRGQVIGVTFHLRLIGEFSTLLIRSHF